MKPRIRKYAAADVPALCGLWLRNFDDTESFVRSFHAALPQIGGCMVAELEGKIIGAAYALMGQQLAESGKEPLKLGFLYGVSVDGKYRRHGVGAAVVSAAYALAKELGAETVAILPAREHLYDWYGSVLGMKHVLFRSTETVSADNSEPCAPISAGEYLGKREALLENRPHVLLTEASMDFAKALMTEYGGDLYAVSGGVAAAYIDGGLALVRELLLPEGGDARRAAAAVAYAMGTPQARLFLPSRQGDRYILSDRALPADCVWNLSFD